jgi:hypothetical protein
MAPTPDPAERHWSQARTAVKVAVIAWLVQIFAPAIIVGLFMIWVIWG